MVEIREKELVEINGGGVIGSGLTGFIKWSIAVTPSTTAVAAVVGIFALGKKKKWW